MKVNRMWRLGAPLVLVCVLAAEAFAGSGQSTTLVSRQSGGGPGGNAGSSAPAISANGRYVAFETEADNLGGRLDPGFTNVYLHDRNRRRTTLVSRRTGANGRGANGPSFGAAISANGRYVAYSTQATNLGGRLRSDPATFESNVYVYDRAERRTVLVSRRSGRNGMGAAGSSSAPSLSANGRYVSFATTAPNLGGRLASDPGESSVYVHDLKRRGTELVSRRGGRKGRGANGDSSASPGGGLSGSGRYVVFASEATNLGGPTQTDPLASEDNVYVHDRLRRRTRLVSRLSGPRGRGGNDDSVDPFISANGRIVAFESRATNLGGPRLAQPALGEDSVYAYDLQRAKLALVSRRSGTGGQGANGDSDNPALTANGRYVVFQTDAGNLGGGPDPGFVNSYVYDRKRQVARLEGRASGRNGAPCDNDCEDPFISGSGLFLAFEASADNLGGPQTAGVDDVYVRKLRR